jgi:TonB-linked SusC/RagA family outer membrane protein
MLCVTQVFAQNRTVTGTVTAKDDGLPIPGATVKVKGTTNATVTNSVGKYSISVPAGASLVISFVGYETTTVTVGSQSAINVSLATSANQLGEVVITTSLGVKHQSKELGYAAQTITPKELTQTAVTNVAQGLTGKVAGLGIYTLSNGVDPQIAINLRGDRSILGNNNALIVVDGIPVPQATIGSIDPGDIADVTILKGAGAAALYGSQASNGAILITTKRGTTDGKPIIGYENSFQAEKVAFYPKLQNGFGPYGGETGLNILSGPNAGTSVAGTDPLTGQPTYIPYENQLYGPPFNGAIVPVGMPLDSLTGRQVTARYSALAQNPIQQFFQTGYTEQNTITFQQGDNKNSFYMSAQNAHRTTVVPGDSNDKDAFRVSGHRTYGIFSVDYSVGYTKTKVSTYVANNNDLSGTVNGIPFNVPGSFVTNAGDNDLYSSVLQWPAFLPIKNYSNPDSDIANASNFYDAYAINPYWILDHTRDNYTKDVLLSQVKLRLDPTEWLSASYQIANNFGVYNERETKQEVDFTAYGISDPFGAGNVPSGFTSGKSLGSVYDYYNFGDGTGNGTNRIEGTAELDFHKIFFKDFKTNLIVGNDIFQEYQKDMVSGTNQLLIKDLYNLAYAGGIPLAGEASSVVNQIAYFADLDISYKGWLSLEGTFRNEQDSRLSKAERSFNYPSAKLSFVPTDALPFLKDNKYLSYLQLRASISQVGQINIGPYNINNVYSLGSGFPFGSLGGLVAGGENYSAGLKPELTKEIELGGNIGFFNNRLNIDYTYYNQHDKNQTLPIGISSATGYTTDLLNIGETESYGQEVQLTGQILTQAQNHFGFTLGVQFSQNESKVISLLPGVTQVSLGSGEYAVVGKPFPMLEGTDFVRDPQGHVVVSATTGYPTTNQTGNVQFGRTTPEYIVGLTPKLDYKFISLAAVFEYRGGDVVYNGLGSTMTFTGSTALTTEAGRQAFVYPNSVIQTSPGVYVKNSNIMTQNGNYGFWQGSAFPNTNSPYVTSGAFWKLREIDLAFKLDQFVKQSKFIKGATFALTGRNLFIWVPKSNIFTDPEFSDTSSTANNRGVNDVNELPGTRIFGADLKLTF